MKKIPPPNLAVFIIFFGLAMIEVLAERDWIEAGFFAAVGIVSLRADFPGRKKE